MNKSIIAIGDIHGCVRSLEALWKKLKPYKDCTHVFVGDYIDRGPDSKGVIDFLLKAKNERDVVFLQGNHEYMLLNSLETGNSKNWMLNGGKSTLSSYNVNSVINLPDSHIDFYIGTQLYYETDDYFFVHAGAPAGQSLDESKKDDHSKEYFLWGRDHLDAFETPWEKTVVFGHTPRENPIRKPKMIGIDTGCVYNKTGLGKLTAAVLPETKFIQQISLD